MDASGARKVSPRMRPSQAELDREVLHERELKRARQAIPAEEAARRAAKRRTRNDRKFSADLLVHLKARLRRFFVRIGKNLEHENADGVFLVPMAHLGPDFELRQVDRTRLIQWLQQFGWTVYWRMFETRAVRHVDGTRWYRMGTPFRIISIEDRHVLRAARALEEVRVQAIQPAMEDIRGARPAE